MRFAWLAPVLVAAPGCIEWGPPREDVPGDYLGRYRVEATIEETTCGEGALGSSDQWSFEVKLSREGYKIYWVNGREVIPGELDREGRFSFLTQVAVEVAPAKPPLKGCTVLRNDAASGTATLDDAGGIPAFVGALTYDYTIVPESDCLALVGIPGGFAELPCGIDYQIAAERLVEED